MATPLVSQTTNTAAICAAYGAEGLIAVAGLAAAYAKTPNALEFIPLLLGIVTIAMMPWRWPGALASRSGSSSRGSSWRRL